jgi:hypothetical protein
MEYRPRRRTPRRRLLDIFSWGGGLRGRPTSKS